MASSFTEGHIKKLRGAGYLAANITHRLPAAGQIVPTPELLGNVAISKKIPTHAQDHGDALQREGRVLSMYPRRPKAEALAQRG